jgi:hypothetical protein
MLFDIPFIADWQKIREHRQRLTNLNNARENKGRMDYDYKVGQKVLIRKEGILRNAESRWHKYPLLITSVHTNGTITVQRRNKIERMNIQRVKPFEEDIDNEYIFNSLSKHDFSPLSQNLTLRLVVPKLTARVSSQSLKHERFFFYLHDFFLIEPMLILHSRGRVM